MSRPPIIQRAYELAGSQEFSSLTQILRRLVKEGYGDAAAQLDGRLIRSQLVSLMCNEPAAQSIGRVRRKNRTSATV